MFHVEHLQYDGGPECFTWNITLMADHENQCPVGMPVPCFTWNITLTGNPENRSYRICKFHVSRGTFPLRGALNYFISISHTLRIAVFRPNSYVPRETPERKGSLRASYQDGISVPIQRGASFAIANDAVYRASLDQKKSFFGPYPTPYPKQTKFSRFHVKHGERTP